ncbi:heterokaryon incompatibility protein-domain-containing protein [Xylaria grammica]|nr:heterokaryon incompatibility protein-domain-containing protein [Xylaria grammica]
MDSIFRISDDSPGDESQDGTFVYSSGQLNHNEIRLLVVLPHLDNEAEIHCRIFRYSLESMNVYGLQAHPFMALSYVWGDAETKKTIFIYGRPKTITQNLYDALLQLRNPRLPLLLWVDSVCINQDDLQERSQQVSIMCDLYSKVNRVLCWLGRTDDSNGLGNTADAAKCLDNLETVFQSKDKDGSPLILSPKSIGELNHHLSVLCTLPFWHRVWITQEIVLSRKALFLWGSVAIELTTLEKLLKFKDRFIPANWYEPFAVGSSALTYANFTQSLEMRSSSMTLQRALLATRHRSATDARDCVYGVLALVPPGNMIVPDYTKTVRSVYLESFKAILRQESNLDALSACVRGWNQTCETAEVTGQGRWPTWLPDWSHKSLKEMHSQGLSGNGFGIGSRFKSVLLDCHDYDPIDFSACGGSEKSAHILRGDDQLRVHGIEFDTVEIEIDNSSENPNSWADEVKTLWDRGYLRNVYDDLHVLRNACRRTMRYGHCNNIIATTKGLETTPSFSDDRYVIQETPSPTNTATRRSFEPFDEEEKFESDRDKMVRDRMGRDINHTDRYFLAESESSYFITRRGFVGRSPMPVRVGDKICIFFGGKVPFLLRQQPSSNLFTLVGETYIHGIMKGAAMASMKHKSKDFILV